MLFLKITKPCKTGLSAIYKKFHRGVHFNHLTEENLIGIPQTNIRNFCIIAHIDHGKSTLSDRILELTGAIVKEELNADHFDTKANELILDSLRVEKERGITVKAKTISMVYAYRSEKYLLNLIDTPGHVDFSFEVIRSLRPCQGAILLVDSTKGVQAQTVANYSHAKSLDMKVIPVINKIDLPAAEPETVKKQINDLLGGEAEVVAISAKTGLNVESVLDKIIEEIPYPKGNSEGPLKARLYDAMYVESKGVVLLVEVIDGSIKKGDSFNCYRSSRRYDVHEVGILQPDMNPTSRLNCGQVGYVLANMKDLKEAKIGDTIYFKDLDEPLPGYEEPTSVLFSGIYPIVSSEYPFLKKAISKLQLTDSSLNIQDQLSSVLGLGFRIGFLGLLHLDVFTQRLRDEYDMSIIITPPSVPYRCKLKSKKSSENDFLLVDNAQACPPREKVDYYEEPIVDAEVITPREFYKSVSQLVIEKRGEEILFEDINDEMVKITYEIPMGEVIVDFYDILKSMTKGYASLSYKLSTYRKTEIKVIHFLVHGEQIDALGIITHESKAMSVARDYVSRLKKHLPKQLFSISLQAKIDGKIICRDDISALRKNVTAKCYGGDYSRKLKLLERQKKGKEKMRMLGSVQFSSDTFYSLLKDKSEN